MSDSAKEARDKGSETFLSSMVCKNCKASTVRWTVSKQCTNCFPLDRSKDGRKRARKAYQQAADMTMRSGEIHVAVTADCGRTWKVIGLWEVSEFLK